MWCIWVDEARARLALQAAHATYRACAALGGASKNDLPVLDDPADQLGGDGPEQVSPAERSAQVSAFIAATGGGT